MILNSKILRIVISLAFLVALVLPVWAGADATCGCPCHKQNSSCPYWQTSGNPSCPASGCPCGNAACGCTWNCTTNPCGNGQQSCTCGGQLCTNDNIPNCPQICAKPSSDSTKLPCKGGEDCGYSCPLWSGICDGIECGCGNVCLNSASLPCDSVGTLLSGGSILAAAPPPGSVCPCNLYYCTNNACGGLHCPGTKYPCGSGWMWQTAPTPVPACTCKGTTCNCLGGICPKNAVPCAQFRSGGVGCNCLCQPSHLCDSSIVSCSTACVVPGPNPACCLQYCSTAAGSPLTCGCPADANPGCHNQCYMCSHHANYYCDTSGNHVCPGMQ